METTTTRNRTTAATSLTALTPTATTGIVVAFAGSHVPDGWELCDGRMLDRDDERYAALFRVIGTMHGGDGNPNFQLPDYRGIFLRGADLGRGRDPDRNHRRPPGCRNTGNCGNSVGSIQDDLVASHSHAVAGFHLEPSAANGFDGECLDAGVKRAGSVARGYGTSPAPGAETRPKNAYVNYLIKL